MDLKNLTRKQKIAIILEHQQKRQLLRREEAQLKAQRNIIRGQPLIAKEDMALSLSQVIPRYLQPMNIGKIDGVMWDYIFPLELDWGIDPLYTTQNTRENFIQNDQEAAFLLMGISRTYEDIGVAGKNAPIGLTIRDRSSTYQFNDEPIPLHVIGEKGQFYMFDTPILVHPNAKIQIEGKPYIDMADVVVGSGKHEFVLIGMKARDINNTKVLAHLFV